LEIQGIDTGAGLLLTGGNRARYEILLRMFVERQADTVGVIRLALSEGDTGAAERAAHSLKGVAATLGARALSAAAAEAEVLVRTGQDPEQALEALSLALEPVINGIEAALPPEADDDSIAPLSGDPSTAVAPLARLKQLLETDDGEAADFVIDAKSQLAGVLTPGEIKKLSAQVGNFEFDAALENLSGIASRLSIDLGGGS
jgi:HPt (histidine-containing phosphotransfer) domain-containing protein